VSPMNESMTGFLDALTGELQRLLSADRTEQIAVSWSPGQAESAGSDGVWRVCGLGVDPACRIFAGADGEMWDELDVLSQAIQHAAKAQFGGMASSTDLAASDEPPAGWARVPVAIVRGERPATTLYLALSPELAAAIGGAAETSPALQPRNAAANPLDILQHVEVPVSVSFGRTRMLLKDLLALSNGSVVQLDRELGDEVEVRVNNCVIARGEVVAVEGNYGVRILEIASSPGGQGVRGALRVG